MTPSTIPTPEELKTMSTKTPRTDEATIPNSDLSDWGHGDSSYCDREKMAELETELLTALAENKALREALEKAVRIMGPYKLSDTWHGHVVRDLSAALTTPPPAVVWESQLREAEEDAERLAKTLRSITCIQPAGSIAYNLASEALAAHEGRKG